MTSVNRLLAAALLCLLAPLALAGALERASPESVGMSSERLARLTETVEGYVADGQLAGTVTLVARHGKVAYFEAAGFRDREAGVPMRTDAIFRIASQTKAIVSVGAMMLVEEGKLSLSDPVGEHLPEFQKTKVAVPSSGNDYAVVDALRPITIRDLLTHTSGFGYGTGLGGDRWAAAGIQSWYFANRDEPIRETVARMASLPAQAQPGERWIYGYSTDILGAVIEVVSGMPLDRYLEERIFAPLGMTDTYFYLPPAKRDRLAVVYSRRDGRIARAPDEGQVGQGEYVDGPRVSFSGGAGLVSTAADYARFLQMLLNGGELDGRRLLSRKTVELMTVNHLGDVEFRPGEGFGLGFAVVEDVGARGAPGSVGEFGWGGAYHTTYWVDPREDLVVVYLTQLLPSNGLDDHDKVRALVYQAIVD
ncbi:MAG TPA: serine hydrolase domain-containing protein [Gammaproteobacteria bacterium]